MKLTKVELIKTILEYKPKNTVGSLWKKSIQTLNKLLRELKRKSKVAG